MVRRLIPIPVVLLALAVPHLGAWTGAGASPSIEYQLLGYVNGGRAGSLTMHSGLVAAARAHARTIASAGLSHSGALSRIRSAPPDPFEENGPPDDGFTGTWCENLAYVSGGSASDVAARIYNGWRGSPTHLRCMQDSDMTAAGIGVYYDGRTWWAVMEAMEDRTLPGSAPAAVRATSRPAPAVRETEEPPEATARATAEATRQPESTEAAPSPSQTFPPDAIVARPTDASPLRRLAADRADAARPAADRGPVRWWSAAIAALGVAVVFLLGFRRANARRRDG